MFGSIVVRLKRRERNKKWRMKNQHNSTTINSDLNMELVEVGKYTYGDLNILNFSDEVHVKIGHYCSIASNVYFLACADHNINTISTFPYKVKCLYCAENEAISKGDIIVGDDVWIGQGAIILSGITIGQGAVVAAGAVVTKDVPPYAIVGGNPAKVIKYRFSDDLIGELLKIDYSNLEYDDVKSNLQDLYVPLEKKEQLQWLPKK